METQEERGRLMETDGGAKGAAGGGRRADAGGLPRRSLAPGAPASGASPQRRLGHPHLQRRPETLLEPKARRPAAKGGLWSPHLPFSGERRLKPTLRRFLLSQTPRTAGRGPDEGGEGARPGSRSHSPRRVLAQGRHCSAAAASPRALAGSPPSSRALSAHKRSLARPLVHTRAPRSSSQVARPRHLPPCQNRSAPAPDPGHSRHAASSLRFQNSAGRNSGRLDGSERGHAPAGRRSEEDKGHTECEGQCVCGGRAPPPQAPLHP